MKKLILTIGFLFMGTVVSAGMRATDNFELTLSGTGYAGDLVNINSATISDVMKVNNTGQLSVTQDWTLGTTLSESGTTAYYKGVEVMTVVDDSLVLSGGLTVEGDWSLGSTLTESGTTAYYKGVELGGSATFNETVTINDDGASGICLNVDNDGTNIALNILQDGALASGKNSLYVKSTVQNTAGSGLVHFHHDDGTTSTTLLNLENDGLASALYIAQNGILASSSHAVYVYSNADQDGDALVHFKQDNASSDEEILKITNDSSANSIHDDSGAHLTAAGAWVDSGASEAISQLDTSDYLTKLKNLKLYNFWNERERYGVPIKKEKKNGKLKKTYNKNKINPDAKVRKGFLSHDPTTPVELIRIDKDGDIGHAAADGVNFLLATCKELLARIEDLEDRVTTLEGG